MTIMRGTRSRSTSIGERRAIQDKRKVAQIVLGLSRKERPRLLEIGPGQGRFGRNCGASFDYVAVESNRLMAEALIRDGYDVKIGRLPDVDVGGNVDIILLEQVFEHLETIENQINLLRIFKDILNPDGLIVIAAPDYMHWGSMFFDGDYTHNIPTTMNRTIQMMFDEDLKIEYTDYFTFGVWGGSEPAC